MVFLLLLLFRLSSNVAIFEEYFAEFKILLIFHLKILSLCSLNASFKTLFRSIREH